MHDDKSTICKTFRDSVYHFQADEVPPERRRQLQAHLDACPRCARYLEVEDSFLRFVKARGERVPAPPGLETRIRARLAEASTRARHRGRLAGWLHAPAATVLAAGLVLAISLGAVAVEMPGALSGGRLKVLHVVRAVTVVDQDCDRAGRTVEQQRRCRNPGHVNALKPADGLYWQLSLGQLAAREIALDPERRGERLEVEGDFYPELSTILIERIDGGSGITL